VLDPPVRVRPSDLDDAGGAIDVPVFEREQLRRPEPGRRSEHDHRPEGRPEQLGERADLCPRLERPLFPAAPARVGHPALGRVLVDQLPRDRPIQYLPQCLRRFEAMPLRNRQPPRTHLLGRELDETHSTQFGGRLPEQPAQLRDSDAFTLMRVQVFRDPLAESVSVAERPPGTSRATLF
jgi:hypothetical protein